MSRCEAGIRPRIWTTPAFRTLSLCMSLSMPRGPSVVRMVSTTAIQALMLLISCGLPWLLSVPSFKRMIWGCMPSPGMPIIFARPGALLTPRV